MMAQVGSTPLKRIPRLFGLAVALGVLVILIGAVATHGFPFTLAWLLGAKEPYPQNAQIASCWWLALGFAVWSFAQFWQHRASAGRRLAILLVGPVAATWVLFSWTISVLFYGGRIWRPDESPSGVRWLLDAPVMTSWRRGASWALEGLRLPASIRPMSIAGGGSEWSHTHETLLALGVLNEAMLAMLLTTGLVLGVSVFRDVLRVGPKDV